MFDAQSVADKGAGNSAPPSFVGVLSLGRKKYALRITTKERDKRARLAKSWVGIFMVVGVQGYGDDRERGRRRRMLVPVMLIQLSWMLQQVGVTRVIV